jgi:hypothetical protein
MLLQEFLLALKFDRNKNPWDVPAYLMPEIRIIVSST